MNKETRTARIRIETGELRIGLLLPDMYVDAEIDTGNAAAVVWPCPKAR